MRTTSRAPRCPDVFEAQTGEILRLTREKDEHTLRYDWFASTDETAWEVHEAYVNEDGLIEHNQHVVEARDILFRQYAFDHRMSVYGEISPHLRSLFAKHAGGVSTFMLLEGLAPAMPAH